MKKAYRIKRMDGQNVLITGGLGFIGSNLAHRLVDLGANTTIHTHTLDKLRNVREIKEKLHIVKGDVRDFNSVKECVKGQDYVFHLAAQTSNLVSMENPFLDVDVNCKGTLNVLEACRKFNKDAKVVFSGTTGQAGRVKTIPVDESLQDNPTSIYDANKLVAEKYCSIYYHSYGIPTTTLRFATLFGERQQVKTGRVGVVNFFIKKAMLGETITIFGKGDWLRDYVYIGNVVEALTISAQSSKTNGEFYVVGTGRGTKFVDMVKQLVKTVKEVTGKEAKYVFVPFPEDWKRVDVGDFIADYSKLSKATGWYPRISFEEGLRRTVLFYKDRLQEYLE